MQKISIPETSVTINYQLDFYDSNNQFTKIKLFEKVSPLSKFLILSSVFFFFFWGLPPPLIQSSSRSTQSFAINCYHSLLFHNPPIFKKDPDRDLLQV